jgi:hypothetical protein
MSPKEPEESDLLPLLIQLAVGYLRTNPSQADIEDYRKTLMNAGMSADSVKLLFSELNNLGRQPDPQSSLTTDEVPPSILLYIALLVFAVILIVLGFNIKESNWSSLALNLATEIIGAVLILIIVDKRLRNDELQAIHRYASSSSVQLSSLFIPDIRDAVSYAKALSYELKRIQPKNYVERSWYEDLLEKQTENLILHGVGGCGKSTLLQSIVLRKAEEVKRQPRSKIPIIFPMRRWNDGEIVNQLWETFRGFSNIKYKRFCKWLQEGKFIIILDGLDESYESKFMLENIRRFNYIYPKVAVLASCRSSFLSDAEAVLGFPSIELLGLSKIEAAELIQKLIKEKNS